MKLFSHFLLSLSLLASAATASAADKSAGFVERFQKLDSNRWYISDGWSNGDFQNCTWSKSALKLDDGLLTLSLVKQKTGERDYACAELQSTKAYGYGTYEAEIRTDRASGANAAFFTYAGQPADVPHDEIDFEVLEKDPGEVSLNTFRDGKQHYTRIVPMPGAADAAFHLYSFTWKPGRIRWFIDGQQVYQATGPDLPRPPQKIFLSHWGSDTLTDWMGPFHYPGRPLRMQVKLVAYSPPGTTCPFKGSVLCGPGEAVK